MIAAAAKVSVDKKENTEPIEEWITALSSEEKDYFFLKVATGEINVGIQLINRLRELFKIPKSESNHDAHRRSFSQLLENANQQMQQRQQREKLAAQKEKIRKLEVLAKNQDKGWSDVSKLLELKQSKTYDQAVAHLVDLRNLAEYQGKLEEFKASIKEMQKNYSTRTGFLSRIKKVGLL